MKQQRLNIFLMKQGTGRDQAIVERERLRRLAIAADLPFQGDIWIGSVPPHPPAWLAFVRRGTAEDLGQLRNQAASCLIVLTSADRVFCVAFGYARNWIDERRIERRFGMIVTLNVVDPERIKSVDHQEFELITRTTRSQTSAVSNMDNFGIDVQRDLLRSVTGNPTDEAFAKHVSGSDSLVISCPLEFPDLGRKCAEALRNYERTTYRDKGFGWIDNFRRVGDPEEIENLNRTLLVELQAGAPEHVYLSPPSVIDTQEHIGFLYPAERGDPHPDIRMQEYIGRAGGAEAITIEMLQREKIRHFSTSAEHPSRRFSVYDALLFERREGNKLYVLTQGEWFEIDQQYVGMIQAAVAAIPEGNIELPDAAEGEWEAPYNARAAQASGGRLALLDRRTVQYGSRHSRIEVCDLFSRDRDLIHVKVGSQSSLLSHLFNQGVISAQLLRDQDFRALARAVCPQSHQRLLEEEFSVNDYRIVYAIISHADGAMGSALPFFSKQSVVNAVTTLRGMGYRVCLQRIPVRAPRNEP